MRKVFVFLCSVCLLGLQVHAQQDNPSRRVFNVGTFVGFGGVSVSPIPTLDLRYRGTTLRLAPGYNYNGLGITQELLPISKSFYNVYWLASVFYVNGTKDKYDDVTSTYNSYSILAGIKYYMGTRLYSELQLGTQYTETTTPNHASTSEWLPYFEFGIGINLFRNYPKKVFVIDEDE
jgi:hypothetical protein